MGIENFRVNVADMARLINSADGMRSYGRHTGWSNYPQRYADHWGIGFRPDMNLQNDTFVRGYRDGGLNAREASLAMNQMHYDKQGYEMLQPWNHHVQHRMTNAMKAMYNLFWGDKCGDEKGSILPEVDVNQNGKFDYVDLFVVAQQDGNPYDVTDEDIKAARDYGVRIYG